ncbi:hypothetical protein PR003_g22644 [Phytophthora rubi]|uniref:Uncharacterized protein n=2 Tax=Phytophthora rubi TaxID=129364 RepID=A0A6A4D2M3_9STRA|nr:hypothetical protein PR003_g22644 [Phytophthora rubi]
MCEMNNCDVNLDENAYYDDEADYYYGEEFEEDTMPYETVASIPTNDYYDDEAAYDKESTPEPDHEYETNPEVDACRMQAASVMTACDKVSTPEPEHDQVKNPEVDACRMQAASVMTACDKVSTPEPEHDQVKNPEVDACILQAASVMTACDKVSMPEPELDYEKNPEAEAGMLQAASVMTACDKVPTPVSDHDYEEKQEVDACAQQAAPLTTARDMESAPEPDPDCEPTLPPDASATQAASVTSTRGEASALEPQPDHEESSGWNTPESAAEMPAEVFLSDDMPDRSVNAGRVLFQRPSCEPDPNRTVIYESFGMKTGWGPARAAEANPALVAPTKPPESPPPVVEEPQAEGVDGPELAPKRATQASASPAASGASPTCSSQFMTS